MKTTSSARTVWKELGRKTLREYHDLYNLSDVLFLADVFDNFRDVCIDNYGLDPAWYYTSQDAVLKMTGVDLEFSSDYDMLLMIKQGIKGGISTISDRLTIFDENLIAVHMKRTKVCVGMCILEISKTLMYDFHYNYIKNKYDEGDAKLLFTDTDSVA